MGNHCCGRDPTSVVWAGDDWGSIVRGERPDSPVEKHGLLLDGMPSPAPRTREVRVRISKKQLEEVVKKIDRGGGAGRGTGGGRFKRMMRAEEMVERLIEKSEHVEIHRQRSWRPALQSIPELNSFC